MIQTESLRQYVHEFVKVNGGLHCYALAGWLLFLVSPYLLDSFGKVGVVFYFGCALPWLFLLPRIGRTFIFRWKNQPSMNLYWVTFCVYLSCSTIWYENATVDGTLQGLRYLLFVLCYLSLSVYLLERYQGLLSIAIKLLICVTALHAIYSLLHLEELLTELGRMQGAGAIWNELVAGNAYALAAVATVHYLIVAPQRPQLLKSFEKLLFLVLLLCLVVGVYFTGSRSSGLAAVFVILLMLYMHIEAKRRLQYRILVILVAGGAFLMISLLAPEYFSVLYERGLSFRPDIWSYVIEETAPHWLFGQGYHSEADIPIHNGSVLVGHAHSLYLSVYRFSGLLGLGTLVILLFLTIARKIRGNNAWKEDVTLWIFLFALLVCVVNGSYPIDRPGWIWLVFWIPLVLILAHPDQSSPNLSRQSDQALP